MLGLRLKGGSTNI